MDELREGLYWAREILGKEDLGRGRWCIVCVYGKAPFLNAYVIAYQGTDAQHLYTWNADRWNASEVATFNYNSWEFGPRIEMPEVN